MPPAGRVRLDQLLVDRGLAPSRARAQALILAGRVFSGSERLDKSGRRVEADIPLEIQEGPRFVGRGGIKLDGVVDGLTLEVADRDVLDVGASTGGFTHALIERGARRVIALDVGRGQLDWTLRNDSRVHPLEGVNARNLAPAMLPFLPSLVVIDVSFISLRLVLPAVCGCTEDGGDVVALVKPQFEVGRESVGRGGIVRDPALHATALREVAAAAAANGWPAVAVRPSPLPGATGNREFFLHLRQQGALSPEELESAIVAAVREQRS